MSPTLKPRVVLFDVYRTLVDIWTDEHDPGVWMRLAYFLSLHGLRADAEHMSRAFFERSQDLQAGSTEKYPEVDVLDVFSALLKEMGSEPDEDFVRKVTQIFRLLSLKHLQLFPDTLPALELLRPHFRFGLVSNAQRVFLEPELAMLGLPEWMQVTVVSSDHGFQKPDPRLFNMALDSLGVSASEAVFVGDTVSRDICGALESGIFAVLIDRDDSVQRFDETCKPNLVLSSLDELRWWLLPDA
jgi:putative hydrolase of the HAD superfamily